MEGFCSFPFWECGYEPMRKSTDDFVWDFVVLCNEQKANKKPAAAIRGGGSPSA
jgi:hypothetical protein